MASNLEEALQIAERIGYPLMVRPSYVLGGRGMEVVHDEEMLRRYVAAAVDVTPERPILIDKFLENAIEARSRRHFRRHGCLCPGRHGTHRAGRDPFRRFGLRHSSHQHPRKTHRYHLRIHQENRRRASSVVGLMNIQYAIANDMVYILEANPRASRTVPLVSKVCNISMARIATQVMLGKKLADLNLKTRAIPHFGVKEAVFPFNMFPEVDPILGPEMRSTGEVLGMADSFGLAFYKAQEAAQQVLPTEGTVLITGQTRMTRGHLEVARAFRNLGFRIKATNGTHHFLAEHGMDAEPILKMHEGRPNIVDAIKNREIQLVINTPSGKLSKHDDSYIRKAAIKYKIPYITTIAAAIAAAKGIAAFREGARPGEIAAELPRGYQIRRRRKKSFDEAQDPPGLSERPG